MKKVISTILTMVILMGTTCIPGHALETQPRESYVFSNYWVMGHEGTTAGEINVSFSVTCSHPTTIIGASSIEIYRTNGTHVHTEEGTVENGLLRNGGICTDTYTYQGVSGEKYYAVVNFYGVADGITETRTLVTDTITAP